MPTRSKRGALPPPTKSESAFLKLLGELRDGGPGLSPPAPGTRVKAPSGRVPGPADAFIDKLFENAEEYASRERYAGLGDAVSFNTKVAGVSFEGRQDVLAGLREGDPLALVRQPDNMHDPNAIAVMRGTIHVGFLNKDMARKLAPKFDDGVAYTAEVTAITGGGARSRGVNIRVFREVEHVVTAAAVADRSAGHDEVRRALIGERPMRDSQREVL